MDTVEADKNCRCIKRAWAEYLAERRDRPRRMTREEVTHARHVLGPAPGAGRLGAVSAVPGIPVRRCLPDFRAPITPATSATRTRSSRSACSRWASRSTGAGARRPDTQESQRIDRLSAFVENDHVSGVYEVIDVLES
jgi:hypothetical protein